LVLILISVRVLETIDEIQKIGFEDKLKKFDNCFMLDTHRGYISLK